MNTIKKNDFIWSALSVIIWAIFIAFCIETGALVFNYIFSLINPVATENLYKGLNLSAIYHQNKTFYTCLFSFVIALSTLKAYVFYLIIKMFQKLNLVKPFSEDIAHYIVKISYYALSIGIISKIAHQFSKTLIQKGYDINTIETFWNDGGAFFLMFAILFVVATIFKKGIELQSENDLTI